MAKSSSKQRTRVEAVSQREGETASEWKLTFLRALLILALGFWIYAPVLHGDWLGDDDLLVTQNSLVHDPAGLWKIWFDPGRLLDYQPIKVSVVWLQWQLWGANTFGYHLTNVILHLVDALLVWWLLSKFRLRWAWLGGLLFAIHPVLVESVAWIAELKNTLSLLPFLLAMGCYIDYEARGSRRDYCLAMGLFLAAMLCKGTMVMFPVVILLYIWWRRGRIDWNDLKASAPFFAVSLVMGLITVWFLHHHSIGKQGIAMGGPLSRLACAGLSLAFYFSKCLLPVGLMPIYPRWIVDPPTLAQFLPWPVLVGTISWLWKQRKGWGRHALMGLGFFLINLAPFIGFTAGSYMAFTWVMDHIVYLPLIGLIGLMVAGLSHLDGQLPRRMRLCGIGLIALVMALLAVGSHRYAALYVNKETLWMYAAEQNPQALPAYSGLGIVLLETGRLPEALAHAERAVRLGPAFDEAHNNLGVVLLKMGRLVEAEEQFSIALKLDPDNASARNNLGEVLAQTGRPDEALVQFNQALSLRSDFADAFANRGQLKRCLGDGKGAVADLDQASRLDPKLPQPYLNRGALLQAQGDFPGALSSLRRFRQLAPGDPNADYASLWIWILRRQQNQTADADRELAAALDKNWNAAPGDWVSTVAQFFLGRIDETTFLAAAASPDQNKDRDQHCEAWYYAGMKRLLAGDKIAATADFRECLATGKTDFFEDTLAQAQLNALNPR